MAAAEKRDLLARLLARLAHEIRNPLSSLDIHVQLLEEDLGTLAPQMREQLTPRLEDHPRRIAPARKHRRAIPAAGRAVGAGPGAGREVPRSSAHVCELLRPEAAAREIEIVARVDEALPQVAWPTRCG
jgi:signal transduction histidine kinase